MVQRRSSARRLSAPLSPSMVKVATSVVRAEKALTRRGKRTTDALLCASTQPKQEPNQEDDVDTVKQELQDDDDRGAADSDAGTAELSNGDEQQQEKQREEIASVVELSSDTTLFLEALERDAQRKVVAWRPFELPFSSHEIELIEVRCQSACRVYFPDLCPMLLDLITQRMVLITLW